MSLELTGVHGLLKRHKLFTHKYIYTKEKKYKHRFRFIEPRSQLSSTNTKPLLHRNIYHSYLILSYIHGDDLGTVYCKLNDRAKKQIIREVVKIQRRVSELNIRADAEWTWNCFVDEMLNRAEAL